VSATAIIPVKRFGAAKQRLSASLRPDQRERLAGAMLADVLAAVSACTTLEPVIVVTGEPAAADAARAAGADVVSDPLDSGHSEAALLGVATALDSRAERCALLPGDCPLLAPVEIDAAVARMSARSVAVIPDRHGTGTNGLLLWPPDAIEPAFGEGSRVRHESLARAAGCRVTVEPLGSLALDVDGPQDLSEMRAVLERSPERGPRTAAALQDIAINPMAGDPSA
jgi:2-phospho-L-lactate/phosphoenolpyruvate guanylyltransferase